LSTYLPDCPHADSITIHHLLSHTAGLGDGLQALKNWQAVEKKESEWLMDLLTLPSSLQDLPFASEPGERYQYSNAGYSLLGLVIEAVTQQGYYRWMREHVYQPIGMHDTDAYPLDMVVPNRAYGYTFGFAGPFSDPKAASRPRKQNCTSLLPYKGEPSGGVYSTAPDLLLLAEALRKHTFLRSEYAQTMMTGKVAMGAGASYGYGLSEQVLQNERIIRHTGGLAGWNASFEFYIHQGYTVIILANYDPPSAEYVAGKIQELFVSAA
jgi:CubicO group peptidase (beta-lactamase class C family)